MSMNMRDLLRWPLATRLAALGLCAALMLDVVLAVRVLWPRASDESFQPLVLRTAPAIAVRAPDDAELVRQASNRTPFDAGGTRAPEALTMTPVPQQSPAPQPTRPRLVGTVVEGRGGFVIVEMPDTHLQVVRVGERAGDLRLRSLTAGEAVFEDRVGTRVTLRSPVPGTEPRP